MAQPSIDSFYASRKRRRLDDTFGVSKRPCVAGVESGSYAAPSKQEHVRLASETVADKKSSSKTSIKRNSTCRAQKQPAAGQKRLTDLFGWSVSDKTSEKSAPEAVVPSAPDCLPTETGKNGPLPGLSSGRRSRNVQRKLFGDDDDVATAASNQPQAVVATVAAPTSPFKMKASLSGCSKIQQLRERLAQFNQASDRLKAFQREHKSDSLPARSVSGPTVEFEIASPQKTPKKPLFPSPVKSPSVRQCVRLIESAHSSLTLPFKYRQLKEMFHCVDMCVSFMHNRKEVITMKKLRQSVQQMLGRSFGEHQLAQLCTVFPRAFNVRRERHLPHVTTTPNSKDKWHLVIEVNLDYDRAAEQTGEADEHRHLTPKRLLQRAQIFSAALLDMTRQHHADFLASLQPPLPAPSLQQLTRWHPEFPLEEVPEICGACLPAVPADQRPATATDLLLKASQLLAPFPALTQCLQQVASHSTQPAQETNDSAASAHSEPPALACNEASTAGLPAGLLARIRAREAARASRQMTRSAADERQREMLARLPALVRAARAIFVAERRGTLSHELLVARLAAITDMPVDEVAQHVAMLAEHAPQFASLTALKQGRFVRINKQCDVNALITALEQRHAQL